MVCLGVLGHVMLFDLGAIVLWVSFRNCSFQELNLEIQSIKTLKTRFRRMSQLKRFITQSKRK
jgi:hypothetical protein